MESFTVLISLLLYLFMGDFVRTKQLKALEKSKYPIKSETNDKDIRFVISFFSMIVAPIWFLGAIVRQVFIEDWK